MSSPRILACSVSRGTLVRPLLTDELLQLRKTLLLSLNSSLVPSPDDLSIVAVKARLDEWDARIGEVDSEICRSPPSFEQLSYIE